MEAYLTGRRQRVKVLDTTSSWLPIPAVVPQGSVLALYFSLSTPLTYPTTCSQFADDTALSTSTPSLKTTEQQLQNPSPQQGDG